MASHFWDQVEAWHEKFYSNHYHGPDGFRSIQYFRSLMEPNWSEGRSRIHPIANELLWAANVQYFRLMILEQKLRVASALPGFDYVRPKLGQPDKYSDAMAEVEIAFRLGIAGLAPQFVDQKQDAQKPDLLVRVGSDRIWVEVTSVNPPKEDFGLSLVHTLFSIAHSAKVNVSGIIIKPKNAVEDKSLHGRFQDAAEKAHSSHRVVRENQSGMYTLYFYPSDLREQVPLRHSDGIKIRGSAKRPHVARAIRALEDKCQMEYGSTGYVIIFDRLIDDQGFVTIAESDSSEVRDVLQAYPHVQGAALITSRIGNPQMTWNLAKSEASNVDVYALPPLDSEGLIQWENDSADAKVPAALASAIAGFKTNLANFLSAKGISYSGKL